MFFARFLKLIMLASVLCISYISIVNYTIKIKHNTKVSSSELDRQNSKVIKLQGEISSAIAAKAYSHGMVKIPISHATEKAQHSEEMGETRLASIKK